MLEELRWLLRWPLHLPDSPGQGDKTSCPGEHGRADSSNTDVPEDPRPCKGCETFCKYLIRGGGGKHGGA